jgi:septal ring factor EnvC (AmiA/AmiB activator)
MARTDALLKRYDLRELEALVERKRSQEERNLTRLRAKRKKLEAELKQIDKQVAKAATHASKANRNGSGLRRRPNARRLNDTSLADALAKVFKTRKKPIHYKDLTNTVIRRGLYKTRSKNLLSTVAVTLKRDKRFKKVEPGMYVMK